MLVLKIEVRREDKNGSSLIVQHTLPLDGSMTPLTWSTMDLPVLDYDSRVVLYGYKIEPNARSMTLEELEPTRRMPGSDGI